jgi:polyribonucleotide nucleotidyltransferase
MNQKYTVARSRNGNDVSPPVRSRSSANGAVNVCVGETNVFVTACVAQSMRPGQDFFPLTVDYREKYAAAGRFPGGYFKREGRPFRKGNPNLPALRPPLPSAFPGRAS